MPFETDDFIHLENPDYKKEDFRKNNKGEINIVGTINFGNGVSGRLGLLKKSGKSAVYIYLFKTSKWDMETAKEWMEKDRTKRGKSMDYTNKKFKFIMPLIKGADEDDGDYYIKFALSTTSKDLENEQVSEECLDDMIEQAKTLNSFQSHVYGLDDIIGPIVDAWKETKNGINQMWIKVRVRPGLKDLIKELIDTGVRLGGSIGGSYLKDKMENGVRVLEEIKLLEGSLTPIPVNQDTLGTAEESTEIEKKCSNGICNQIIKSINKKYYKDMEVKDVSKTTDESYEALTNNIRAAINQKYNDPITNFDTCWVKLTYPDSVIVEFFEDNKLYEITYAVNDAGEIELGEPVEVEAQYVEKKMEIFKEKALYIGEMPDYEFKSKGDEKMDEDKVKKMLEENNKELLKQIKEMIPEEEVDEEEVDEEETPEKGVDAAEIAKEVKEAIYKSLGIEDKEPETEDESGKIVIMDSKSLQELQDETIKKTILGITKERSGSRKSKPIGAGKFNLPEETKETKTPPVSGKVSTRKAAEMLAVRKGLIKE